MLSVVYARKHETVFLSGCNKHLRSIFALTTLETIMQHEQPLVSQPQTGQKK